MDPRRRTQDLSLEIKALHQDLTELRGRLEELENILGARTPQEASVSLTSDHYPF